MAVIQTESPASSYVSYRIHVFAATGEWQRAALGFSAQGNVGEDCAYALQLDYGVKFADYDCEESLKLAGKLLAAWRKEEAPRARLIDGKPYLDNCELSRFLQASEKLGLHVSRFTNSSKGYDWARDIREEQAQEAGAA